MIFTIAMTATVAHRLAHLARQRPGPRQEFDGACSFRIAFNPSSAFIGVRFDAGSSWRLGRVEVCLLPMVSALVTWECGPWLRGSER